MECTGISCRMLLIQISKAAVKHLIQDGIIGLFSLVQIYPDLDFCACDSILVMSHIACIHVSTCTCRLFYLYEKRNNSRSAA